jgi:hypothetical protein
MKRRPKIELARLREIGWSKWDPIGLREAIPHWQSPCPDEYDRYLRKAAGMLWAGESETKVADYLTRSAVADIGVSPNRAAATATAAALGRYIESLRVGDIGKRKKP